MRASSYNKDKRFIKRRSKKTNKVIKHEYNTTAETFCEKHSMTCQSTLKGNSIDSLPLVIDVNKHSPA